MCFIVCLCRLCVLIHHLVRMDGIGTCFPNNSPMYVQCSYENSDPHSQIDWVHHMGTKVNVYSLRFHLALIERVLSYISIPFFLLLSFFSPFAWNRLPVSFFLLLTSLFFVSRSLLVPWIKERQFHYLN